MKVPPSQPLVALQWTSTRPKIQNLTGPGEHTPKRERMMKDTQVPQLALPLTQYSLLLLPPPSPQLSNGHNACHFSLVRSKFIKSHPHLKAHRSNTQCYSFGKKCSVTLIPYNNQTKPKTTANKLVSYSVLKAIKDYVSFTVMMNS